MIQNINLYCEYYSHKNIIRKKEIDESVHHNLKLNFINLFYIFCPSEHKQELKNIVQDNKKAIIIEDNKRKTFQDIFNFANLNFANINITFNNDIELTSSFNSINLLDNDFYCLSRWESKNEKYPFCYRSCDSQDVWVWKNKNKIQNANFYYGILGCDNKLAFLANQVEYSVKNPAYTYKCLHNHSSGIREGSRNTSLRLPPPYLKVCPTK